MKPTRRLLALLLSLALVLGLALPAFAEREEEPVVPVALVVAQIEEPEPGLEPELPPLAQEEEQESEAPIAPQSVPSLQSLVSSLVPSFKFKLYNELTGFLFGLIDQALGLVSMGPLSGGAKDWLGPPLAVGTIYFLREAMRFLGILLALTSLVIVPIAPTPVKIIIMLLDLLIILFASLYYIAPFIAMIVLML